MRASGVSLFTAVAVAASGLGSCQAQDHPRPKDSAGFEDLRGSAPVRFQGRLWFGGGNVWGVLEPVERDGNVAVQTAFSATMFELTWHNEPVAAVTNTIEIDCKAQKYRRVDEIWLSSDGAPLTRRETVNPQWVDARGSAEAQWACGDQTVQTTGLLFSSVAEFVSLYDAEAASLNLRPRVSGPTIVPRAD
ncbi:MAG: hypothetical protein K2X07_08730 [Caulobacteraceae bacterium]|nr:hypothetical protein [Caulobacteraceae bacterium]